MTLCDLLLRFTSKTASEMKKNTQNIFCAVGEAEMGTLPSAKVSSDENFERMKTVMGEITPCKSFEIRYGEKDMPRPRQAENT